jgi:NarL family two-component system sensor histidine kinase LiaS
MKYYSGYPNIYKNDSLRYSLYDYQIQKGLGNYKSALRYLELRRIYEDSVSKNQIEQQIQGIKAQLALKEQTEKLQKAELEKFKTQNERQNQFRWFFFVLSFIGLLSTVYVFRTNRKLKSNNRSLLEKNKEISQAMLKGQTIERQRVALDLHDNLGSTLSALWLSVDTIDKSKMNVEEKAIHQNLRENLEKAYTDVRLLSHNLLPEEFEKQGLTIILQGFVRKMNKNSAIKFDLKISENFGRVNNKIEFELYSICLELVNNIIKHSKASEAKIELSRTEKQILLTVSDNGIGTFKNDSDGKGMKNVKARVESLNGVWKLQNTDSQGVSNKVLIPI